MTFIPGQLFLYRLMAIKAYVRALREQKFVEFRFVRVMAFRAVTVHIRRMLALGLFQSLVEITVTGYA